MKLIKTIKLTVVTLAFAVVGGLALAPAPATHALDPLAGACTGDAANTEVCKSKNDSGTSLIGVIVNTLLFIIGSLAVIMLIWGGIRYTTSAGNASSITAAKNTIMYSIIGLIVALLAYAIVNWVLKLF